MTAIIEFLFGHTAQEWTQGVFSFEAPVGLVEIVGGPFKGMRAKIRRVDRAKEDVTLELLEATFTLPITVHADYVKVIEKSKEAS